MENVDTFDKQLLNQLQGSVPGSFEKIYQMHVKDMLGFASQRLSSLEEARDLVHDIFLNFYERREHIVIKTSLRGYLFTALKFKIIDHIRKNVHKNYYADLLLSLPMKAENSPFNEIVYKDLNEYVEKEIDRLSPRVKEVFLLSRKKHLNIAEIAAHLGSSEQTVKNQLSTALKKLRPMLEKVMILSILMS